MAQASASAAATNSTPPVKAMRSTCMLATCRKSDQRDPPQAKSVLPSFTAPTRPASCPASVGKAAADGNCANNCRSYMARCASSASTAWARFTIPAAPTGKPSIPMSGCVKRIKARYRARNCPAVKEGDKPNNW
jgi:hypothetical protein